MSNALQRALQRVASEQSGKEFQAVGGETPAKKISMSNALQRALQRVASEQSGKEFQAVGGETPAKKFLEKKESIAAPNNMVFGPQSRENVSRETTTQPGQTALDRNPMAGISDFFFGNLGKVAGSVIAGGLAQADKRLGTSFFASKEGREDFEEEAKDILTDPWTLAFAALETPVLGGKIATAATKLATTPVRFLAKKAKSSISKTSFSNQLAPVPRALAAFGEKLTNIKSDVFLRYGDYAKKQPAKLRETIDLVKDYPEAPFNSYAENLSRKIISLRKDAKKQYDAAKRVAISETAGQRVNVNSVIPVVNQKVKKLGVEFFKPKGKKNYQIRGLGASGDLPFSRRSEEYTVISEIVNNLNKKNRSTEDLFNIGENLRGLRDRAYSGSDRQVQAIASTMYDVYSEQMAYFLGQEGLIKANQAYRAYYTLMDDFGNKVLDPKTGELREGAERWLKNSLNPNKGETRSRLLRHEKILGQNIPEEITMIDDVNRLFNNVPSPVRRRMEEMLISFGLPIGLSAGVGVAASGQLGGAVGPAGVAATTLLVLSKPQVYARVMNYLSGVTNNMPDPATIAKIVSDAGLQALPRAANFDRMTRPDPSGRDAVVPGVQIPEGFDLDTGSIR